MCIKIVLKHPAPIQKKWRSVNLDLSWSALKLKWFFKTSSQVTNPGFWCIILKPNVKVKNAILPFCHIWVNKDEQIQTQNNVDLSFWQSGVSSQKICASRAKYQSTVLLWRFLHIEEELSMSEWEFYWKHFMRAFLKTDCHMMTMYLIM